jgi:hypothetical protein
MGTLMVCCPATGLEVSLGVELDSVSFDRIPEFLATFHCGACAAEEHLWSKADAWIAEAEFRQSTRTKPAESAPLRPQLSSRAGARPLARRVPAEWGMPLAA